jgi:hypothetical protein
VQNISGMSTRQFNFCHHPASTLNLVRKNEVKKKKRQTPSDTKVNLCPVIKTLQESAEHFSKN